MAGLLDWLSKQKDSAMSDYAGLMDNYPNAQKFGSGLINNISQHIPSNADFKSPEAMRDWGTAAALIAPIGLTFTGPKSMGWNHDAANTATKLLDNGADPAQVWKDHLIGRMPDKSLFSEIDDSNFRINTPDDFGKLMAERQSIVDNAPMQLKDFKGQLKATKDSPQQDLFPTQLKQSLQSKIREIDNNARAAKDQGYELSHGPGSFEGQRAEFAFQHPDLFKNYPELGRNLNVMQGGEGGQYGGMLQGDKLSIYGNPTQETASSIGLHELQHAIQGREGWARGSNLVAGQHDYYNNLLDKFKANDGANTLNKYNSLSEKAKPYYGIDRIQRLQNISAPRQLFNSSDFYKHSTELRDILGAPPRSGSKLQWAQDAGRILARKQKEELTWGGKDLLDEVGNDRTLVQKMIRSIEGKQARIGQKKYYESSQTAKEMGRVDPRFKTLEPDELQSLYRRTTGEAQARATQDRMNMNMQQRRDTYPLAGGLLSDIPLDQLINRYR